MPRIPHWYTLKRKARSGELFAEFVQAAAFSGPQKGLQRLRVS